MIPFAGTVRVPVEPNDQVLLLLLIVNPALAVNSPDRLTASLICMADESEDDIELISMVLGTAVRYDD
jgi:hypothetical protein